MYHSLLSFTFMASFIINCCYMHMLLLFMFPELTIWIGQPAGVLLLGEEHFPHSQHALFACSSLCRVEAAWALPFRVSMSIGVVVVQVMFSRPCRWVFFVLCFIWSEILTFNLEERARQTEETETERGWERGKALLSRLVLRASEGWGHRHTPLHLIIFNCSFYCSLKGPLLKLI